MAGFAFARYEFSGRTVIFIIILSTLNDPPLYHDGQNRSGQHLLGTDIVSDDHAIWVFLMRQFMLRIPKSLLEAARIDGASEPYIYAAIMLPLCKPPLLH